MFYIYADGESIYDPTVESYYLFEPKLSLEFGKAGSLEFVIPSTNVFFNSLKQMKTLVTVKLDDEELFRGRVLSIETDIQNFHKVYCEGDLSFLVDSVQKGEKYTGTTRALFNKIITAHNARVEDYKKFTVGNVTIDDREIILVGHSEEGSENINVGDIDYKQIAIDSIVDEWNNTFDYIQNCLIDYCGGYLRTRRQGNTTYIDYYKEYAGEATQDIRFGNNILDLTEEINAEDLFTVLIPLGDDNLTIASVNGGSDELADTAAVSKYGRIIRTNVFSNVTEASTLLENAKRYLKSNVNVPTTITVNAIDMHLLDEQIAAIHVGDRVHVIANPHGLNKYLTCTQIDYDLANPENNTYTFGNPKQSLTERYKEDKRKQSDSYSNGDSASSAYAGAGAGAVAAKKVEEEQAKKNENFEELTNIIDDEDGKKSIQAWYREWKNDKIVLEQEVGINFDAQGGNTNLGSIARTLNEKTGQYDIAIAQIQSHAVVIDGRLEATERMVAGTEEKAAELELRYTEFEDRIETEIYGKADKLTLEVLEANIGSTIEKAVTDAEGNIKRKIKSAIGINIDVPNNKYDLTNIRQTLDAQGNAVAQQGTKIESFITSTNSTLRLMSESIGYTDERVAAIELTTSQHESKIELKADKTVVAGDLKVLKGQIEAAEADIKNLQSEKITTEELAAKLGLMSTISVNSLYGTTLQAGNMYVGYSEGGGAQPVATQLYVRQQIGKIGTTYTNHAHLITENNDGTITLGYAVDTPQNFDIRATRTYREGVAAAAASATVKVTDIIIVDRDDENYPTGDYYNRNTYETTAHILVSVKGVTKQVSVTTSGTKAYNAGLTAGSASQQEAIESAVNAVDLEFTKTIGNYNEEEKRYPITVRALMTNNKTKSTVVSLDATDAYNHGRRSVTISSIGRNPDVADYYDSVAHTVRISAKATANNNETITGYIFTDTKAYDYGKRDGRDLGKTEGRDAVKVNKPVRYRADTYDTSAHTYTIYIKASADNGKENSDTFVTDTKAWDSVTISNITKDSSAETYTSSTKKISLSVTAKAANGKTYTNTSLKVDATKAYEHGKTDYNPTKVTWDITANADGKRYDIVAHVKNNAGTVLNSFSKTTTDGIWIAAANSFSIDRIERYRNDSFSTSTHAYTVYVKATDSNGKTKSTTFTTDTTAWDSVKISNITKDSNLENYDPETRKISISVTARASNGQTYTTNTLKVNANAAYIDGLTDGQSQMSVGEPYIQRQWVQYEYRYRYRACCYANGTTYYGDWEYFD